jgi:hypothetical protein
MSTIVPSNAVAPTPASSSKSSFDAKLDIAKSSKILVDYLNDKGQSAINAQQLSDLAQAPAGAVPADVAAAASYMTRHTEVFEAIETHDVPLSDGLSGVWNLEWAAAGGLNGTSIDAIAKMTDAFDGAIAKSAEITDLTTGAKTELDAAKQRPNA